MAKETFDSKYCFCKKELVLKEHNALEQTVLYFMCLLVVVVLILFSVYRRKFLKYQFVCAVL